MNLKPITIDIETFPDGLRNFLIDATIYDSSSSPEARVLFIDKADGYFLKMAAAGSLAREAEMTHYFKKKRLGLGYLTYLTENTQDFLLKAKIQGEDYTSQKYLDHPKRLCDSLAENLRFLHTQDFSDCPILNGSELYLENAEKNAALGKANLEFVEKDGIQSIDEVYHFVQTHKNLLKNDTLLHGDYCLPNIILEDWQFKGFIDLDHAGVGDRHLDLFWGAWTLAFNLGTDDYRDRFFDAYGREKIDKERLKLVACCEVFG